jgi:glycosyltransferase involved in cell wall biosynthesis
MRVLIVSLSTYTSRENRGKLDNLAARVGALSVISGDVPTMWDEDETDASSSDSHAYEMSVLPCGLRWSWMTRFLIGFDHAARRAGPEVMLVEAEPWQMVTVQALVYSRRHRIPIGIHFAEDGPRLRGVRGRIRQLVAGLVLRRFSYAIGWSTHSADVARRLAPEVPVFAMPATGVADWQFISRAGDVSAERERWFGRGSDETPKLAFVGRLVRDKGIADLMAVCDALAERTDIRVAIAGSGPCQQALSTWASTRPWVTLHGLLSRADVSRCFGCADLALVPSRSVEQFGKVAIEAMAAGTPVIGYACGALPEVIGDGGVLVTEGDTAALENEILRYISLPDGARAAASVRATERASAFSDDQLAEQLVDVWRGLIHK